MRHLYLGNSVLIAATLVACGGGGGVGNSDPLPSPVLLMSQSSQKIPIKSTGNIAWTTTNSAECSGSGQLSGPLLANGSLSIKPAAGGKYNYTITCTGSGGTVNKTVSVIVPMQVFSTSYENKNVIPFDHTTIPMLQLLGTAAQINSNQTGHEFMRSAAFADFFQEGEYSGFVVASRVNNIYSNTPGIFSDSPGRAYFLSLGANNNWIDRTSELLKNESDRDVCVTASYSLVADFNNDGKPDVFVACHGLDYEINIPKTNFTTNQQVYLSNQILFLSQKNGTYKRVVVPYNIYGHKASAADINGDGITDLVITNSHTLDANTYQTHGTKFTNPFVLLGNGDGTFTKDTSYIPENIHEYTGLFAENEIYAVDLIPIDGRIDLILSGGNSVWFKQNINKKYSIENMKFLPRGDSQYTNSKLMFPTDILYVNNYFYFVQNSQYGKLGLPYDQSVITKINATTLNTSIIYDNIVPFNDESVWRTGPNQVKHTSDGYLVPIEAACASGAGNKPTVCNLRIKM